MTPSESRQANRSPLPEIAPSELQLQPPPPLEHRDRAGGLLLNVIPMLGSVGSIVVMATMGGGGGRQYVAAGMFLFATIGFLLVQIDRQRTQRHATVGGRRTDYLRYLGGVRETARDAAARQRHALAWQHPPPSALAALAAERSRLWELDPGHARFLQVRFGSCAQPLMLELVPPESAPVDSADPVAASALHRLLTVHRMQPDLPATLDLRACSRIMVCGKEEEARATARALVCAATASHSPIDVVVAVLASAESLADWDWVKWLPHSHSRRKSDAVGPARMVTTERDQLTALLPAELAARPRHGHGNGEGTAPHVLVVVDDARLAAGDAVIAAESVAGVTELHLSASDGVPQIGELHLRLADPASRHDGRADDRVMRAHEEDVRARVDRLTLTEAEAFARRLAPLPAVSGRTGETASTGTGGVDLIQLLGLGDVRHLDPGQTWRSRSARDRLRVPIGVDDDGAPVCLDLKESAEQGMGPHGLVIGATGSGKSEFLRTLVLGLGLTHSPEELNMVLVDFKGGATFAGMAELPHVSALITNLASELTLVDRMQDALSGEMVRRQELLRAAGVPSLKDYARTTDSAGGHLPPLPSLLVVVDEFSEMLAEKPEFIDLFVAIGRLGRGLGLHLLLASQRLEEGRLRGLESHLSYRVGLRTFSAQESRAALGVPDAYELPAMPGLGYLRPDPTTLQRFNAAYVSGPVTEPGPLRTPDAPTQGIWPFSVAEVRPDVGPRPDPVAPVGSDGPRDSVLDLAVRRISGRGPAAHQVWLPPLDQPGTLDDLMPDLVADPRRGLISPRWRQRDGLVVPLGTVDRPREQCHETLTVDLTGAAGHVAVVGGPRSGKSTLLRTILISIALTTTPLESQFFVLDFGGGAFAPLTRLPHVAGVAARAEPDTVRRIVAEIRGIVERRERYFRELGLDSIESYRAHRAEGLADDGYGDVFLVVDGWAALRESFDDLETDMQHLAQRALTFGVHILAGASRWSDFRAAMRDLLGTRLELRLGDALDSEIDRKSAALVPTARPGRGIRGDRLHFLAALPRIDADGRPGTLGAGIGDLVDRVCAAWSGPAGPKLRLLPERITLAEVHSLAGREESGASADSRLLLGVEEQELKPIGLDPDTEPHLLVLGESRSGKSALLRAYAREVMRTRSAREAQLVVVDYRRALLGEIPDEYLLHYLSNAGQATPVLHDLAAYLQHRVPGPDVTPEQLRDRSWWSGAEVFVLVDDYDLVATPQGSPVHPLQPLLAQAGDVGLHLVIARRTGGASRALFEPVIQSLRDLAAPGLMLSGSPEEGPLLGPLRPTPTRPGRARLVTRDHGVEVVQLAWVDSLF